MTWPAVAPEPSGGNDVTIPSHLGVAVTGVSAPDGLYYHNPMRW